MYSIIFGVQDEEEKDIKAEIKEEEEETLVTRHQQSMEEGCPLYSQDSTREDQNYTDNNQVDGTGQKELKNNSMSGHSSM